MCLLWIKSVADRSAIVFRSFRIVFQSFRDRFAAGNFIVLILNYLISTSHFPIAERSSTLCCFLPWML